MKLGPNTKPHRDDAGYVAEMKCKLGGHIVIYDRENGGNWIDADTRWIVMHQPSGNHVAAKSLSMARSTMQGVAKARTVSEACEHADILPVRNDQVGSTDVAERQARTATPRRPQAEVDADLATFMADPENEPSEAGIAARRRLFAS